MEYSKHVLTSDGMAKQINGSFRPNFFAIMPTKMQPNTMEPKNPMNTIWLL